MYWLAFQFVFFLLLIVSVWVSFQCRPRSTGRSFFRWRVPALLVVLGGLIPISTSWTTTPFPGTVKLVVPLFSSNWQVVRPQDGWSYVGPYSSVVEMLTGPFHLSFSKGVGTTLQLRGEGRAPVGMDLKISYSIEEKGAASVAQRLGGVEGVVNQINECLTDALAGSLDGTPEHVLYFGPYDEVDRALEERLRRALQEFLRLRFEQDGHSVGVSSESVRIEKVRIMDVHLPEEILTALKHEAALRVTVQCQEFLDSLALHAEKRMMQRVAMLDRILKEKPPGISDSDVVRFLEASNTMLRTELTFVEALENPYRLAEQFGIQHRLPVKKPEQTDSREK